MAFRHVVAVSGTEGSYRIEVDDHDPGHPIVRVTTWPDFVGWNYGRTEDRRQRTVRL